MNTIPIIFENQEIYIINKPSGLAVQGGKDIFHSVDKDFAVQVGQPVYLVHRLDKDTAGLMIVAKNPQAANKWTKLISSKQVEKDYIAICAGKLNKKEGVINDVVVQHGITKNATTYYQVMNTWTVNFTDSEQNQQSLDLTQIKLKLQTGRMHQIRIQLAKQNCPIIGDDQHGNFKINKIIKKQYKIKNLLLASVKLTIPLDNKVQAFQIDLPNYFKIFS